MLEEIHINYGHKKFFGLSDMDSSTYLELCSLMQSLLCQCREKRDENTCSHQE